MVTKDNVAKLRGLIERGMGQPLREAVMFLLDDYAARNAPAKPVEVSVAPAKLVASVPIAAGAAPVAGVK